MSPGDLHFVRPAALLLLAALPLCWLAWRRGRADPGAWRDVVDAHLLPHLLEGVAGPRSRAGLVLASLSWTLACIALAGPAWEREAVPLYRNEHARVLALELAPSMLAQDVKPSRLARARFKIDDILARSRDVQTALIGYGGDAFVAAPLTDDVETVKNLVDALDPTTMPVPGNATSRAIGEAVALIEQGGLHRGEIVVLADSADADAVAAARRAHARGFEVSVLGIGTDAGAPVALAQGDFLKDDNGNVVVSRLDEAALRALASAGGGRYARLAADSGDLDALLATGGDADAGEAGGEASTERWRDRGPWLVLALLPLALAGFRRGWLMALALVLLAPPRVAQAASWTDLWLRADQQAAAALADGDAKRAAGLAPGPDWQGAAAYRGGDYAAAESAYARARGADAAYNRGNALARLGRYEEAIAAYDDALRIQPGMEDAIANRAAVQAYLEQQKSEGQQPGDDGEHGGREREPGGGSGGDPQQGGDRGPSQDGPQPQDGTPQAQDGERQEGQGESSPNPEPGDASPGTQDRESGSDPSTGQPAGGAPDAAQQEALSKAVDAALGKPSPEQGDGEQQGQAVRPAAPRDDAAQEKQQALEQWLERVPDDPGGLLRRKFQLEYQRRQQGGGEGG